MAMHLVGRVSAAPGLFCVNAGCVESLRGDPGFPQLGDCVASVNQVLNADSVLVAVLTPGAGEVLQASGSAGSRPGRWRACNEVSEICKLVLLGFEAAGLVRHVFPLPVHHVASLGLGGQLLQKSL